ncbi:MAG TPA: bifunctional adenosylcobinamide kinase/adenosylcobinamide-phosphate guanylyltransferase [Steroidobacteraceae bacterium]|nr:bifunctional adenosylcobinamide kinase/adenosylcobinamide-phosphate guanylyltransferase [Steroidobacteraceae bacterium]
MRELILGGARSGKSSLALQRAHDSGRKVVFVATATASDAEMQSRILLHRDERPAEWKTIEAATGLATVLQRMDDSNVFIIIDCLTLLLSNVLCAPSASSAEQPQFNEVAWSEEMNALLIALSQLQTDIALVSNEVGFGIVPENAVARRFRDEQGRLNQRVAACCERVTLMVAGVPLTIKPSR